MLDGDGFLELKDAKCGTGWLGPATNWKIIVVSQNWVIYYGDSLFAWCMGHRLYKPPKFSTGFMWSLLGIENLWLPNMLTGTSHDSGKIGDSNLHISVSKCHLLPLFALHWMELLTWVVCSVTKFALPSALLHIWQECRGMRPHRSWPKNKTAS